MKTLIDARTVRGGRLKFRSPSKLGEIREHLSVTQVKNTIFEFKKKEPGKRCIINISDNDYEQI